MQQFKGKLGVLTGAGTGIGRALTAQLVAQGCRMAVCDVSEKSLDETIALCREGNPRAEVSSYRCDVADETQVQSFAEHVRTRHNTDHINLLINNAGISGGGSFVNSSREEWDRTFNICWSGVYLTTRAFLPMLLQSRSGHIVNMSSANALRAVLGGHIPHTAYSAAKFAVRGFSEALIHDFRFNAPHLKVSVVMPGAVGTEIVANSARILGHAEPPAHELQASREVGLSPDEAAALILQGVSNDQWRILVGRDTDALDELVRQSPQTAYDPDFVERWRDLHGRLIEQDGETPHP